jgi:Tol biopolymer transport system component
MFKVVNAYLGAVWRVAMSKSILLITVALLLLIAAVSVGGSSSGFIERVSVSSDGQPGNGNSGVSSTSANGRFVAFLSDANNLVPIDTNSFRDIFVHDRLTDITERVSVSSSGQQANGNSGNPSISADGRYVAFSSYADNLVLDDTNGAIDIFVHDRQTGITERVSVDSDGFQIGGTVPTISPDGRYVALRYTSLGPGVFVHDRQTGETELLITDLSGQPVFCYNVVFATNSRFVAFACESPDIVPGDNNERDDVFVLDRHTGIAEIVSLNSSDEQGNEDSRSPSISSDGRYVAFASYADNLVSDDTNNQPDIFVRDRITGVTERVSVSSDGQEGDARAFITGTSISGDGRYVSFSSEASNLVPGDENEVVDVFIRDRQAGTTDRVSIGLNGQDTDDKSHTPHIAEDGCCVAFDSGADNLVPGDPDPFGHVYVNDLDGIVFNKVFLPAVLN